MANARPESGITRARNEILVALRMIYPAALQAEQLLRSLLSVFPTLEWQQLRRDLYYLIEKGYVLRVVAGSERHEHLTPWRKRWFRVSAEGLEIADNLIEDPEVNP